MAGEVFAGIAAFKTALDIVKGLKDLNDKAAIASAVSELQSALLSAQIEAMSLVDDKAQLASRLQTVEEELQRINDFESQKDNYTLHRRQMGAFVYIPKVNENTPNDGPSYCQHCFDVKRVISPVNFATRGANRTVIFKCQNCGSEFEDYPIN